jgi:Ca-activated chloride channel family protein
MSTRKTLARTGLSVFFALLILSLAALPAAADGIIIPRPPPDEPIAWRDVPLTIKYHHVEVTIENQVATTTVDQVFINEAPYVVEGVYVFPLPEDAAISSFDMTVDGKKLEGRLLTKEEARAIYERIVREQRDPALLEYVGRGAFQASIFPIPPGAERRIELTYSQVLPKNAGLVRYRYPLSTEKYSARSLEDVAVTVHIEDRLPLRAVYSPSHPVAIERPDAHTADVSYEAQDVRPDQDFDLIYSVSEDAVDLNLLTYKPFNEDGYFLLLVTPPLEAESERIVPKDVLLVLDVSGSMEGEKLNQAKEAANYVLDQLQPQDRFNIISFSSGLRSFADAPVSAAQRGEGQRFVDKLAARGSTDINRALLEALAGADPERPTILVFMTDGLPTAGETDPDRIVDNVTDASPDAVRLFAFGVGYDVDTVLLDQLSSTQRGVSGYVKPEEKIDEAVSEFYAKVSAPVLVDVALKLDGIRADEIYPYPLPDLFAGTQLVVAGRYRQGGTGAVTLSGTVDDRTEVYRYPGLSFSKRSGDEFVARLWAQRKIGYLLSQVRLNGPSEELIAEIVDLSTRHGIVTPYTSFLVEEPELVLSEGGRQQLTDALQAPQSGAGGGGLAPAERSGEAAVERAVAEKELAAAPQAAPVAAEHQARVRQVGDKTFVQTGGAWVDTTFDQARMKAERIVFGSDRYFKLLREQPTIGRYLALGDSLTLVVDGKAYTITPS